MFKYLIFCQYLFPLPSQPKNPVGKCFRLCHNIHMQEKEIIQTEEAIEPEILDENGRPISPEPAKDSARPKGDTGGLLGGVFVLAFGFIVTLFVAIFSSCILLPLMLLGRLFGMQVRTFRR